MSDPGPQVPVSTYTFRKFVVLVVAILALIALLVLLLSTLPRQGAVEPSATPEAATHTPTEVAEALPSQTPTNPPPPSVTPTPRPSNTPRPTATETALPPSNTPAPTAARRASPTPPPTATRTPRPSATAGPATRAPTRVAEVTVPPTPSPLPPPSATPVPPTPTPRPSTATPRPTQPPTATPVPPPNVTPHITSPLGGAAVPPGRLVISGLAGPNTRIRVVDGREVIGTTVSGASGGWSVSVEGGLAAGSHVLRAEALDDGGEVEARSDAVSITVLETVTPTTGGEDLPWPVFLLMAGALLALGIVIMLGGAALRAWERTRRY